MFETFIEVVRLLAWSGFARWMPSLAVLGQLSGGNRPVRSFSAFLQWGTCGLFLPIVLASAIAVTSIRPARILRPASNISLVISRIRLLPVSGFGSSAAPAQSGCFRLTQRIFQKK
jgi:hypothetical protein